MKIMDARSGVSSSAGEFRLTKAAFPSRSVRRRLLLRDSLSDRMNPQSIREFSLRLQTLRLTLCRVPIRRESPSSVASLTVSEIDTIEIVDKIITKVYGKLKRCPKSIRKRRKRGPFTASVR